MEPVSISRNYFAINQWVFQNLYPFKMIFYFALMLGIDLQYGGILTLMGILFSVTGVFKSFYKDKFSIIMLAYIGYSLFSVIGYSDNGRPIDVFILSIKNGVVPVLFYFIGVSGIVDKNLFYRKTVFSLIFCFAVGMYLYLASPSWYTNWKTASLGDWLGVNAEVYVLERAHFSSFFPHSYFTGYMSLVALVIIFEWIRRDPQKILNYILLIPSIFALVFSMQRISLGFFVLFFGVYTLSLGLVKSLKIFSLMGAIGVLVYFLISDGINIEQYVERVISRITDMNLSSAIGERSGQWTHLLSTQTNYVFGHGFGSAGHAANARGFPAVVDGENYKLFFELGVVGLILHYVVLLFTISKAVVCAKKYRIELPIILFFVLATIGANPFSNMQNAMFLFWFVVGQVWNPNDDQEVTCGRI